MKESRLRWLRSSATDEVFGSSPPSIYVGWRGYPRVAVGPAAPPEVGDTSLMDMPETWSGLDIESVVKFRLSLHYGIRIWNVHRTSSRYVEWLQELAMSSKPVDIEMLFERPVHPSVTFSHYTPPMGPKAPLKELRIVQNANVPRPIEKAYSDADLKALDAAVYLYNSGIPISKIQKVLSVGALGLRTHRKLVPTRWAITAVDDIVSQSIINKLKNMKELGEYLLYLHRRNDNLFLALLMPGCWGFEWMEAWFPGSAYNRGGREVIIENDWEGLRGRSGYPDIGGCYFASRLAVAEHMFRLRRCGTAFLYREIYEGFNMPVGVWFVRESLREMFKRVRPIKFSSLDRVKQFLTGLTRVPVSMWWRKSHILSIRSRVRSLYEFIGERR
jgi:hypothetical protein